MSDLLIALLARPLRRGMRCDGCQHWMGNEHETESPCTLKYPQIQSNTDSCVYWSPAPGCGLDAMGIPLASPLAMVDEVTL
jgi:hypothetical protein